MAEALAAFHFLRPALLWALSPFALYAFWLGLRGVARSPWAGAVAPALLKHLISEQPLRGLLTPDVALLPIGVLAVLGAAGPTWAPQSDSGDPSQSPLAILVELSRGMGGKDVSPSRAERARLELIELVHARPASPTALVVVAGSAHVLMPLTDDATVLEPFLQALAPDLMPSDGEAFARAAPLLEGLADQAHAPLSVLVVTDGMPPDGAVALAELHRQHGVGFVVLAVGSSDGDPAQGALPLDGAGLDRFADSVGAQRIDLSFAERDVRHILRALALQRARSLERRRAELWEDSGYLCALPLFVGVALWFRRGWLLGRLSLAGLVLLLSGCSGRVLDLWLTPDQQGQLLFDAGHYAEAAERFRDPLRRGLALYAQSRFPEAAAAFASVDTKQGLYNLGNAYAQAGQLGNALAAYDRALARLPAFRDARHNADLVRELLSAQQEDTDKDDMAHAERKSGDAATRINADQLAKRSPRAAPSERARHAEDSALSPAEEAAWLRHVSTDPAEFLKHKLAALDARGAP
jgi:Ca-activated chloride channel family protein